MDNIKKLYKSSGKFDDQQKYKSIVEAATISTPVVITGNSPIYVWMLGTLKNSSARKSLIPFLVLFYFKTKVSTDWDILKKITRQSGWEVIYAFVFIKVWYKKNNSCVKQALCNLVLHIPQVLQYPIYNDCLKFSIDVQT